MGVSRTVESPSQQNNAAETAKNQEAEEFRRYFYPSRFNFPIELVEDLAFYFDKLIRVDILFIRYLCLASQYEYKEVSTIDGTTTRKIFVDLAEARWQWRTKIAQQISKKLEKPITRKQIEKSEVKLRKMGLLQWATLNEEGKNQTRVLCFTKHFMVIAKGLMLKNPDIPHAKKVVRPERPDPVNKGVSPQRGQGVSPQRGQGVPPEGKNESPTSSPTTKYKTHDDEVVSNRRGKDSPSEVSQNQEGSSSAKSFLNKKRTTFAVASDFEELLTGGQKGKIDYSYLNKQYGKMASLPEEVYRAKLAALTKRNLSRGAIAKIINQGYSWDDFFNEFIFEVTK